MALGCRPEERQQEFWIATGDLPKSAGHPFCQRLEQLLVEGEFDDYVETLCEPCYAETHPSLACADLSEYRF